MPDRPTLTWTGKLRHPAAEPHRLDAVVDLAYGTADGDGTVIHGDNIAALALLAARQPGSVKCIYIDPPFNTGGDFDDYEDGLDHSEWLSRMRRRLGLIKTLLHPDGSLWISIDDREVHYLKVLGDDVFGRDNFVANIVREKRTTRENRRVFSFNHEHVLVFAANRMRFEKTRNALPLTADVVARYRNPDLDPRGSWLSVPARAQAGNGRAAQFYTLVSPKGRRHELAEGECWRYTEARMLAAIADGRIWFGVKGQASPRIKRFLADVEREQSGLTPETLWFADECGTNASAKRHLQTLLGKGATFTTPKPEGLLARIIGLATDPDDLVLDAFLGSGTTAAVAQKLGRRWIGIESGEQVYRCCLPRLIMVVDGTDAGGVTAQAGWQGGGGFLVFRCVPINGRDDA